MAPFGNRRAPSRAVRTVRRRRAFRRACAFFAVVAVVATAFVTFIKSTHKAFANPLSTSKAFAPEWRDMPLQCKRRLAGALPTVSSAKRSRSVTYANMLAAAKLRGLEVFREASKMTQGLGVEEMFTFDARGFIEPKLTALEVPVRAVVIPMPIGAVSAMMHESTVKQLNALGYRGDVHVYLQSPDMYHFSVFHASHHLDERAATPDEREDERRSISKVTDRFCPIKAVLERVVVTTGGVVLAGWNVEKSSHGEPSELRSALRVALPNAPKKQLVSDNYILHTTLARLVKPAEGGHDRATVRKLAQGLTDDLCGLEVTLNEAWFVSEEHKLALALRGALTKDVLPFGCVG